MSSQCKTEYKRNLISRCYWIISITGNQKCLLLCLTKGGKTLRLEFQASFAIYVF